jgi:hypothetical protein
VDGSVTCCDVGVELEKIHLLLKITARCSVEGLAHDGDHSAVIELCVIEAVEEVDRART